MDGYSQDVGPSPSEQAAMDADERRVDPVLRHEDWVADVWAPAQAAEDARSAQNADGWAR